MVGGKELRGSANHFVGRCELRPFKQLLYNNSPVTMEFLTALLAFVRKRLSGLKQGSVTRTRLCVRGIRCASPAGRREDIRFGTERRRRAAPRRAVCYKTPSCTTPNRIRPKQFLRFRIHNASPLPPGQIIDVIVSPGRLLVKT